MELFGLRCWERWIMFMEVVSTEDGGWSEKRRDCDGGKRGEEGDWSDKKSM